MFDTPEFEALTKDSLVFVEIDVPLDVARIGEELHKKNQALCEQYKRAKFDSAMGAWPAIWVMPVNGP